MERKIGEGHAGAWFRLGLKELRNALNPSRESVADQEIGLYGTQTQGEIAQARRGPGQGPEQETGARQESKFATVRLDDLRAYAQEVSEEQKRSQGQEERQSTERSQA